MRCDNCTRDKFIVVFGEPSGSQKIGVQFEYEKHFQYKKVLRGQLCGDLKRVQRL